MDTECVKMPWQTATITHKHTLSEVKQLGKQNKSLLHSAAGSNVLTLQQQSRNGHDDKSDPPPASDEAHKYTWRQNSVLHGRVGSHLNTFKSIWIRTAITASYNHLRLRVNSITEASVSCWGSILLCKSRWLCLYIKKILKAPAGLNCFYKSHVSSFTRGKLQLCGD